MSIYSNSKIETFEQCRLKFKYRYIDKIIPEIAKGIEAHLGDMVHRTLEWLYIQVMKNRIPSVNDLISFYSERWQEIYSPNMPIVNKTMTVKDYFNRGIEFLINYYTKYHPFQDNTIATEKKN
ncbi:MAG: PD-(D/E)XK nuclease family protein [Candidatus Pacearchaeota archaeon]|nr:PD-(D/E)XK nuclease family protein [Candidatus Pacearchaeota archaeon]